MLLQQAREGIALHIAQSPYTATIQRLPFIDDGFGGYCIDPSGVPTPVSITGRMSRESRMVQALQANSAGLDSSETMYFLVPYDKMIAEGEVFTGWRIGRVTPLTKFGGIQAWEAALYPA